MITTIKTKEKIVYDTFNQKEDYIYMSVNNINFDGEKYTAQIEYFIKRDDGFDVQISSSSSNFSDIEANTLFQMFHIPQGDFTDMFKTLISKATQYQIGVSGVFGLTGNDWELYIEE